MSHTEHHHAKPAPSWAMPVAVIVAGALIAGAVYVSGRTAGVAPAADGKAAVATTKKVAAVTKDDHIRGPLSADVKVIEFSDMECPFCKRFHPTLEQAKEEYGDKIAWVYRHYPLEEIHPNARAQAEASECVAELGGNDAFWKFVDAVMGSSAAAPNLETLAVQSGVDKAKFTSCVASGRHTATVDADIADGKAAGVRGTPNTIVIAKDGTMFEIGGAQPYSEVKKAIDAALAKSK
jgi:protein-disulfide isomerase